MLALGRVARKGLLKAETQRRSRLWPCAEGWEEFPGGDQRLSLSSADLRNRKGAPVGQAMCFLMGHVRPQQWRWK